MPCRADFKKDAFLYWKVQDTDRLNLWDEAGKRLSVLKRTPLPRHYIVLLDRLYHCLCLCARVDAIILPPCARLTKPLG